MTDHQILSLFSELTAITVIKTGMPSSSEITYKLKLKNLNHPDTVCLFLGCPHRHMAHFEVSVFEQQSSNSNTLAQITR